MLVFKHNTEEYLHNLWAFMSLHDIYTLRKPKWRYGPKIEIDRMNFIDFASATVLKNMDVPVFAHVETKKMFKKWSTKYLILTIFKKSIRLLFND